MKIMAAVLTSILLMSAPALAAPCDRLDNNCLIRKSLQLTYENETLMQQNEHLNSANRALKQVVEAQEPPARIPVGAFFIGGFVVGVVGSVLMFIALRN